MAANTKRTKVKLRENPGTTISNIFLSSMLTIETLHLWLFSVLALLLSFGIASLLTVEHEPEYNNDVSHRCPHRQADGLNHLVRSPVELFILGQQWFICQAQAETRYNNTRKTRRLFVDISYCLTAFSWTISCFSIESIFSRKDLEIRAVSGKSGEPQWFGCGSHWSNHCSCLQSFTHAAFARKLLHILNAVHKALIYYTVYIKTSYVLKQFKSP